MGDKAMSKIEKITINDNSKKKPRNERAHQLKIYAVGSVLILLAIVLLLNVLVDKVFGKALTFDFSVDRSNTISAESENFLNGLFFIPCPMRRRWSQPMYCSIKRRILARGKNAHRRAETRGAGGSDEKSCICALARSRGT